MLLTFAARFPQWTLAVLSANAVLSRFLSCVQREHPMGTKLSAAFKTKLRLLLSLFFLSISPAVKQDSNICCGHCLPWCLPLLHSLGVQDFCTDRDGVRNRCCTRATSDSRSGCVLSCIFWCVPPRLPFSSPHQMWVHLAGCCFMRMCSTLNTGVRSC